MRNNSGNNNKNCENNNDNENQSKTEEQLDQADLIEKNGEVVSQNAKHLIHCLTVIGQVEGHYILPRTRPPSTST